MIGSKKGVVFAGIFGNALEWYLMTCALVSGIALLQVKESHQKQLL